MLERYLVESPHRPEDCDLLMHDVLAMGYLFNFDWGCKSGVHTGWAVIEAENEAQARLVVPPMVRKDARVVKVVRYGPEDFKETPEASER
ncbi:MAG: hypothetical protein L0332_09525 [Chloroflexi bacterium]|nr:hypothetical protein [Chloroflexota bacterium]MCI0580793.1 hypothetical protein [Chloroflexota bacterium]MCI0647300.1 hypothetical protein [Chloroflexota bacterium]MCI0726946.1 hypothetical protein [Chloroflexota bacterium]